MGGRWKLPQPPPGYGYGVYLTSADSTNHVAISAQAYSWCCGNYGLPQLATYTAHADGNLTTKSTYRNMPRTANQSVYDLAVSPSGKLLAVGGSNGLQVFHFNGGSPITHYTGLITSDEINQVSWDNDNHLYAVSHISGNLFVFTVTPTGHHQAPGSPYAITNPWDISRSAEEVARHLLRIVISVISSAPKGAGSGLLCGVEKPASGCARQQVPRLGSALRPADGRTSLGMTVGERASQ